MCGCAAAFQPGPYGGTAPQYLLTLLRTEFGYSRDKRSDCVQVVIALIVTPEGFPLSYEVMAGNTSDKTTLKGFLERIEKQYGNAQRIWVMDRGIPTGPLFYSAKARFDSGRAPLNSATLN